MWVKNLKYFIESDRIRIHKGILTKIQQNIPYRAITDFQLHRSLYDRFLGIGSIRIQTAGQTQTPTGYEGNLAGLVDWNDQMIELRKFVKKFHGEYKDNEPINDPKLYSQGDVFEKMLYELKEIKTLLSKK